MYQPLRFPRSTKDSFFRTLHTRVNDYFKDNNIVKTGNTELHIKSVVMFSLYVVPFIMMYIFPYLTWVIFMCYALSGLGKAGVGLCIMHDANHGSYSSKKGVNNVLSHSMDFIGASSFTWKVQHNLLHHTFTNVYELDEDIDDKPFLRLSPKGKHKKYHRLQHIYAFGLYCLATLSWTVQKDFKQLVHYNKEGFTDQLGLNKKKEAFRMIFFKVFYGFYTVGLPLILGASWWAVLLGFILMHAIAGFLITVVFQLAHVVEGPSHHGVPEHSDTMENTWAIHQLETTANFATKNRFISWLVGGLNYQIEHHLFPSVSHVHYRKISKIVKATAKEFELPYYEYTKMGQAIRSHINVLKHLGTGATA